jgi:hypothetical protein
VFALFLRADLALGNGDPAVVVLGGGRATLDLF